MSVYPLIRSDLHERVELLERELDRQRQRLDAVTEIGVTLGSTLNIERVLDIVMSKITSLLDAEQATLFLLDEDRGELWAKIPSFASAGPIDRIGTPEPSIIRVQVGEGIAGWVARTGQRLNLKDAYKDARFNAKIDMISGFHTTSLLCQPIRNHRRKIIGVVQVLNKRDGYFTTEDETLLASISGHAAVSIESQKLFLDVTNRNIELQQAQVELKRRVEEIDLLYRVEQEMNRSLGLEPFLNSLLSHATEAIQSELGAVYIEVDALPRLYARKSGLAGQLLSTVGDIEPGLLTTTASGGVSSVVQPGSPALMDPSVTRLTGLEPRCALLVPLELDSQRFGALMLWNRTGADAREYSTNDIKILTLLAGRAEAAIMLDSRRRELQHADRLAAIGKALSGVIHDLKTPMTVIAGYSQLMVECEGVEARRKYADGIRRQIAALKSMTQEVLSFARGEESLLLRRVFLNVYVEELAEAARAEVGESGPELVFDAHYTDAVRMDSGKISRALLNLVKNAKEALETARSRPGRTAPPRIVVRIRLEESVDQVVFEVEDNGPGIPAAIRATLFEPFVTVGKRHGTGLGLSIVKKIAEQHRGSVDVTSNEQGTVFRLAIPRCPEARPVE